MLAAFFSVSYGIGMVLLMPFGLLMVMAFCLGSGLVILLAG